jgi:hypothetical protein
MTHPFYHAFTRCASTSLAMLSIMVKYLFGAGTSALSFSYSILNVAKLPPPFGVTLKMGLKVL